MHSRLLPGMEIAVMLLCCFIVVTIFQNVDDFREVSVRTISQENSFSLAFHTRVLSNSTYEHGANKIFPPFRGRDPFNQNFQKFWSKTEWIG